MDQASPETIALEAEKYNCKSVAFTYNEPVIFVESAMDVADTCHARNIVLQQDLQYVYTGNVRNQQGDTTFCPGWHNALIVRDWYQIDEYRLTDNARCPDFGIVITGRFDTRAGDFGRRRVPITTNRSTFK